MCDLDGAVALTVSATFASPAAAAEITRSALSPATICAGSKRAAAPPGTPETEKAIVSGDPKSERVPMWTRALPPAGTATVSASTSIAKSVSTTSSAPALDATVPSAETARTAYPWPCPDSASAAAVSVKVAVSPGDTVAGSIRASTPGGNSATDSESTFAAGARRRSAVSRATESVLPRPSTRAPGRGQTAKSGEEAQPGSWKLKMRVRQLKTPSEGMYSFVYQKVQSSAGSTDMLL